MDGNKESEEEDEEDEDEEDSDWSLSESVEKFENALFTVVMFSCFQCFLGYVCCVVIVIASGS